MNNTLAVRAALQTGAGAAEEQLALIAGNTGDNQLAAVVADLTAAEVAVMVSDADMSKPSLAHSFLSAEQFSGAFARLGGRWGEVDASADYLRLQRDVEDFLCPMILVSPEPLRRAEMLKALLDHELGLDALFFLTLKREETATQLKNPHGFPFAQGTWQELISLLFEHFPAKFRELSTMAHDLESQKENEDEREDARQEFGIAFLSALHEEAARIEPPTESASDDFVDI